MATHDGIVLNEQRLIEDLISGVPDVCVKLFQQARLRLIDLLTLDEASFSALFANCSLPFEINQIWSSVVDWRQRNHLQNCLRVQEIPDSAGDGQLLVEEAGIIENPIDDLQVYKAEIQEDYPSAEDASHVNKPTNEVDDSSLLVLPVASTSSATGKQTTITSCATSEHFPSSGNEKRNNETEGHATLKDDEPPLFLSPNHLRALLEKSDYGKDVLKEATTHKLSDAGRKLVVDTVARFHLSLGRQTTAESMNDLSDVIIRVFPHESKDTYYLPKAHKSPGGKLYSRINYIKQSEHQRARRDEEHFAAIAGGDTESQELTAEVETAVQWLTINTAPWTTVISLWEVSYPARKGYLKQYSRAQKLIDDYPQLREEYGFQLLDIDFRKLGLGNPSENSRKWESLFEPIARYASKHGKDSSTKHLIEGLRNTAFSTDVHLLQLLHVLSTVLIPVKASKGFKPTISVAQSDTFLLASSIELGRIELQKTLETYDKLKIPVVPKLIVIGEALDTASGVCFVAYKAIEYQLPTITKGIDVLLKLYIVLGLPVSRLFKLVWTFIEKFVYNSDPLQGGYVAVNKLVEYLRNQQQ